MFDKIKRKFNMKFRKEYLKTFDIGKSTNGNVYTISFQRNDLKMTKIILETREERKSFIEYLVALFLHYDERRVTINGTRILFTRRDLKKILNYIAKNHNNIIQNDTLLYLDKTGNITYKVYINEDDLIFRRNRLNNAEAYEEFEFQMSGLDGICSIFEEINQFFKKDGEPKLVIESINYDCEEESDLELVDSNAKNITGSNLFAAKVKVIADRLSGSVLIVEECDINGEKEEIKLLECNLIHFGQILREIKKYKNKLEGQ